MKHLLLIGGQLRCSDLLLDVFEMLSTDREDFDVLRRAEKEGLVCKLFRERHLCEVDWLQKTVARVLEATLDDGLCEVMNVFRNERKSCRCGLG